MLLFPETQAKAQAEIDRVVGTNRLPTFEDQSKLPYIDQLIREVIRWQPVTPLGVCFCFFLLVWIELFSAVPHTCLQDDTYRGYRIPKGAIV
jgi:hypothetical protein